MRKLLCIIFIIAVAAACKDKYDAPLKLSETGFLVIEGVVNSAGGATTLTLSRTTQLDNRNVLYEKGASVKIEGEDNSIVLLQETTAGHYSSPGIILPQGRKYRLNIITANGKQYLSDFVAVRSNPPIDSVSWKRENNGLQLYISTHDDNDSTRYYQWEYTETWEFHSAYQTMLQYRIDMVRGKEVYNLAYRDSSTFAFVPSLYYCYNTVPSSTITLGSSAKLSKDIVYLPLFFIPPASEKLAVLYSIDVKQYSWTKDGYAFLESMKKNTEGTGSIFDPQPSQLSTNIRCASNPAEQVIGFFNICPVQEKRIFIKNEQLPGWGYRQYCIQQEFINNPDTIQQNAASLIPTVPLKLGPFGGIATFGAAPAECVDCTLHGTPVKPNFWP